MSTSDVDVIIAGGGPSGCATALFLWAETRMLARPPRVLLLDKAEFPREKICAGALGGRADRALASIGVEVRCPGADVRGLGVVTGAGELAARHPRPIGRVVRRREFDAAFLDEVRARGIEVRTGIALEGYTRTSRGVRVATSAGELTARVLVGADGVGSRVRRAMGLPRGALYAQAVEIDTPWCEADDALGRTAEGVSSRRWRAASQARDVLWFDLRDRRYPGYGWSFPTIVGGESLVCRGVYRMTHGVSALDDSGPDVSRLLADELTRLGVGNGPNGKTAVDLTTFKRFAERGLAAHEPTAQESVMLVGEAAGIDPVLGEGLAQAILSGKAAGPYLAQALVRGDVTFRDWPREFARSRVGLDLALRRRALPFVYGSARPRMESLVTRSESLARAGLHYFAGEHVPRGALVRATLDGVRALTGI
ncbi:MAG: NAD(P)/FAD-dependent oxidoreductase [Deltaproteobacteria bacterium]|nr:NAD(P)/FAD-dependent oxidoreductase [Deltaproteobacteria bacterium]